jgi:hypothetical protein
LLTQLEFAPTNAFFANSLEEKSWWLHVLVNGKNYWWKPKVLSPEEFARYLRQVSPRVATCTPADLQPLVGQGNF